MNGRRSIFRGAITNRLQRGWWDEAVKSRRGVMPDLKSLPRTGSGGIQNELKSQDSGLRRNEEKWKFLLIRGPSMLIVL